MSIWLHRISHESEVTLPLLSTGNYLSIGWSGLSDREFLDKVRVGGDVGWKYMEQHMTAQGYDLRKNRYDLWRFVVKMSPGDWVLVPLYKSFCICEVLDKAIPTAELRLPEDLKTEAEIPISIENGLLHTKHRENGYDLGFFIPINFIERDIPRYGYAKADLTARMKIRPTNANIDDLKESIENTIKDWRLKKPLNLNLEIINSTKSIVLDKIKQMTNPDKFEQLIKWYCQRVGASIVDIPTKSAKKEGDADVTATFEYLKLILYIQAKFHSGSTGSWAVDQITDYKDQYEASGDGYSRIAWVISTADKFNEDAINKAQNNGVNLIDGEQFAEMLLNVGFEGLNI